MKLEAMKRQGVRTDLTCVQNEHKLGKSHENYWVSKLE